MELSQKIICTRCVMDTSDPEIQFDPKGQCNHCCNLLKRINSPPLNLPPMEKKKALEKLVEEIKRKGKGRSYDSIIGVSGGVDSSYLVYLATTLGLKPLAVHLDNGWNSELASHNIEKICKKLSVDLYTHVMDWEEFKDLQLAFLKASTPDSEVPTDHAIHGLLNRMASRYGVKTILSGGNIITESILPSTWSNGHLDWQYIKGIHKLYGKIPLKTFPYLSYPRRFYYWIIKKIAYIRLLDYVDYSSEGVKEILKTELDWQEYGGKHQESLYTKFFQGYILPYKFGFDKRKAHLSNLICAGQMTRDEALTRLSKEAYSPEVFKADLEFVLKKLSLTQDEFEHILALPKKSYWDFPSYPKNWYYRLGRKIYRKFKKHDSRFIFEK